MNVAATILGMVGRRYAPYRRIAERRQAEPGLDDRELILPALASATEALLRCGCPRAVRLNSRFFEACQSKLVGNTARRREPILPPQSLGGQPGREARDGRAGRHVRSLF